jgi:hypothetical protein
MGQGPEKHSHFWTASRSISEQRCKTCKAIKISPQELEHRTKEGNNFFDLVRTTDSYQDFLETREAFKAGDKERMREIDKRVLSRGFITKNEFGEDVLELKNPLPKPSYPDPVTWKHYVVESTDDVMKYFETPS